MSQFTINIGISTIFALPVLVICSDFLFLLRDHRFIFCGNEYETCKKNTLALTFWFISRLALIAVMIFFIARVWQNGSWQNGSGSTL